MTTTFRSATDLSDVAGADTVVVPVCSPLTKEVAISGLDSNVVSRLLSIAEDGRFTGKHGATLTLPVLVEGPIRRVVLVGLGSEKELTTARIASAAGSGMQAARNAGAVSIALVVPDVGHPSEAFVEAWVTGGLLGLYRYTAMQGTGQSENGKKPDPQSVAFIVDAADSAQVVDAITRGGQIAGAVALARDLVNEPAATMTPAAFADRAVAVAREAGLDIEVVEPAELQRMGANALLAVGQGSANPPRLIRMRYRPNAQIHRDPERVIGLVGKCITFDTGGYSIKTYEGMLEMKGDMAGGAAVLATMSVLPLLNCPYAVDATICAAENMISGNAFRPGDVLTALNGITIEVLSTDAEGRLVLADGLVDAARHGATELIDVATLTGAIMVALGDGATGLFSSNDRLANDLLRSSANVGERFWRMPLYDELNERIRGEVGDIKNSGGRYGGAIIGALFIKRFSEGLPWAHLDIAGASRYEKSGALGPKGGSGVAVQTLVNYLTGT